MRQFDRNTLKPFARTYICWKTADKVITIPQDVIAQVMNIDDCTDVRALAAQAGDHILREVPLQDEAGQFNERPWTFWRFRPGLAAEDQAPPLPRRKLT